MKYTIIADSSCDLKNANLSCNSVEFVTVPISFTIGEKEYSDDENVDVSTLPALMKANKTAPKTTCPSPEHFAEHMRNAKAKHIICVTLSSKLSGTYNSACIAAEMVRAEQPQKKIFVLDSLTTSAGMAKIIFKLHKLIEEYNLSFEEVTQKITEIRGKTRTRFLLNDLSNFVKSGRMSKVLGIITSVIPIKLICGDNGEGEVKKYKQVLGFKKGMEELANCPGEALSAENINEQIVISHCNNIEGASFLKKLLENKFGLKNIKTLIMRGIATFFANDRGLALAY